jgi:hypothetical protein
LLQEETPVVYKIGDTWYLTEHDYVDADGDYSNQVTRMATATGGPLNFTLLANGNGGKIVDGTIAPSTLWAESKGNSCHRGYLRWGVNKFRGLVNPATGNPWAYIGFCGSDPQATKYLVGSDNVTTWDMILPVGSNAGLTPGWDTDFKVTTVPAYTNYSHLHMRYHECCWNSVSDEINGEHFVISPGRTTIDPDETGIYEATVSALTGYTETRVRRKLLTMEASDIDNDGNLPAPSGPGRIGMPFCIEYGGEWLLVYREQVNNGAYHAKLAVGEFRPNLRKGTPLAYPNHNKYVFNAMGASALPAWLENANGGTITFNANGVALDNAAVRLTTPFDPAATNWAEVYVHEPQGNPRVNVNLGFSFDGYADPSGAAQTDRVVGYAAIGAGGGVALQYKQNSTTHLDQTETWIWKNEQAIAYVPNQAGRYHRHGLRWYIAGDGLIWLGGGRNRVGGGTAMQDLAAYPAVTTPMYPFVYGLGSATPNRFQRIEFRVGTSGAGVRPTITDAEATSASAVTLTFSANCLGDCTGIVIDEGGSPVSGTWTRPTLATAVFTRTSGAWSGAALTYDISSTDVRGEDDLVDLADATAEAIAAYDAGGDPDPDLAFVGPAIGNRTLNQTRPAVISVESRFAGAISYSLTGTVPTGMTFSTATGAISGTPTTIQTRTGLVITGTDGVDSVASDTFSIDVVEYVPPDGGGIVMSPLRPAIRGGFRTIVRY